MFREEPDAPVNQAYGTEPASEVDVVLLPLVVPVLLILFLLTMEWAGRRLISAVRSPRTQRTSGSRYRETLATSGTVGPEGRR